MRYLFLLLVLTLCFSCGVTSTTHDFDEHTNFSLYKTYNFYPNMDSGLSELNHKRVLEITDAFMQSKGLLKSETPDIYVNFNTATFKHASQNRMGIGIGSGGGGIAIGIGGDIPIGGPVTFLEFTTDVIDTRRNELVWQAIAEKRYNPNDSPNAHTSFFRKIIERSLAKYPPRPNKNIMN